MKFRCETKRLYLALELVSRVVPAWTSCDVLQGVLIHAAGGCLNLVGTDLEVGIRYVLDDVAIKQEGKLLAEAALLTKIVREADGEEIVFEAEEPLEFTVSCGAPRYRLNGLDPEEYPEVPSFQGDYVEIDAGLLARMIEYTAFAAAPESRWLAFTGVEFAVKGGMVQMVGTDGYRLASIKKKIDIDKGVEFVGIVPLKALDVLQRLLADSEEPVRLRLQENLFLAKCGSGMIAAKLIEGTHPDYEAVIAIDNDKLAVVDTARFARVLRQVAVLTSEESSAIRFRFDDGMMTLSARIPERGDVMIHRAIEYEGEPVEVAIKPVYLLDAFERIDNDSVRIELKNNTTPVLFKAGEDYIYAVMPCPLE